MRHKLGVALLATVMALAGTREALRQFDELKNSVTEWTHTGVFGNLLVFASEGVPAAPQQTIFLAEETRPPCPGEWLHSAAQSNRTASRARAASTVHAAGIEKSRRASGSDELALRFAATPAHDPRTLEALVREEAFVNLASQVAEMADSLGAVVDAPRAAGAVCARGAWKAVGARARAAAEWKKLGLKKVVVRVARREGVPAGDLTFRLHESLSSALDFKSLADATPEPQPPPLPAGEGAPASGETFNSYRFSTVFTSNVSFNCDSDPLG